MKDLKATLKKRFTKIYGSEKRLLAIHLNGFTHTVIYDDGYRTSKITWEDYSSYAPELFDNKSNVANLLGDIPHYKYQNEPQEILYITLDER